MSICFHSRMPHPAVKGAPKTQPPSAKLLSRKTILPFIASWLVLTASSPVESWAIGVDWFRTFTTEEEGRRIAANDVSATTSGVYIVGETCGTLPGQATDPIRCDAYIRKYTGAGNEVWTQQIGVPREHDNAYGIAADALGAYISGNTQNTMAATTHKFSPDGRELWSREYSLSTSFDFGFDVTLGDKAVYVVGLADAGRSRGFVRKFDEEGNALWTTDIIGTGRSDRALGVGFDGTDIYVGGSTDGSLFYQASAGALDAFVRKYDSEGNELWTQQFGTAASDWVQGVAADLSGVYVVGATSAGLPGEAAIGGVDAFVRKYDRDGIELWTRQFGTAAWDQAGDVAVGHGGVYVAGFTEGTFQGQTSAGDRDAFVRNYDSEGNEIWTQQFGTDQDDISIRIPPEIATIGISLDRGDVYVAGDIGAPTSGSRAFLAKLSVGKFILKSLGDITGDSRQDTAVVEHTDVTVKKLNNSIINQFQFADGQTPVDVEVMEDINNNGAPEMVLLAEGSTKAEVRDSLTGQFLGAATFSEKFTPIDLEIVPDQSGNQVPELAVLQKKAGATRVEIRDALNGDLITRVYFNPNFTPKDLEVLPNVGGTAALDLAVLQDETDPQQYDRVEIRDIKSKQRVRDVWFGKGFEVKQLEVLQGVNHNGKPELAVLRVGSVNVLVKDAGTGKYIRNVGFNPDYIPLKLLMVPDTDKDGEQELGLMARNPASGQVKIELRDVNGGQLTKNIWYGNKEQPLDAAVYPDINENGFAELGVLGRRIDNPDALLVRIKDARTGAHIQAILF